MTRCFDLVGAVSRSIVEAHDVAFVGCAEMLVRA